ncbi:MULTISPECIES: hypothetical protein [Vagococcus]|uniref:Uncharacterized protein n=1 Tax=Vagococcus fluvialis bH819 TaxID=1255619 RepID=A0A1X6WNJ1_9ENTE|nr:MULTISPECIES: hypothetical protein [Vagococcus]SLM85839.1 hypothetical protein FM121_07040 [Vagococcus fluvialis bH819]HCM90261.1 hypothetical protein [Vagococcus sp.]
MKKFFSILVFVVILAGGGYFVYNEYMRTQKPDAVAVDTGKITVDEINQKEFEKLDKETQEIAKKYKYLENFESFDQLDTLKQEDGSYKVDKYSDEKLFLKVASKQKDGSVVGVFDSKE